MTNKEKLERLVEAGKKATKGHWTWEASMGFGGILSDNRTLFALAKASQEHGDDQEIVQACENNVDFMCFAANARQAIEEMLAENERLREALEEIAFMGYDCPAALEHMTDEQWIRHLNGKKQLIAKQALGKSE